MQSLVTAGRLRVANVLASQNVADLGTKYLARTIACRLLALVRVQPSLRACGMVEAVVHRQVMDQPRLPPSRPLPRPHSQPRDHYEVPPFRSRNHIALCQDWRRSLQLPRYQVCALARAALASSDRVGAMGNMNNRPTAYVPMKLLRDQEYKFAFFYRTMPPQRACSSTPLGGQSLRD